VYSVVVYSVAVRDLVTIGAVFLDKLNKIIYRPRIRIGVKLVIIILLVIVTSYRIKISRVEV